MKVSKMTPEERDRLVRVESKVDDISKDVADIRKKVQEMLLNNAKMGGVMLALTAIGAFIGWALTQAKELASLFGKA